MVLLQARIIHAYNASDTVGGKEFTSYGIEILKTSHGIESKWVIHKRFRQFHALHKALAISPSLFAHLPELPPKLMFGSLKEENIRKRKTGLENYLNQLLQHLSVALSTQKESFSIMQRSVSPMSPRRTTYDSSVFSQPPPRSPKITANQPIPTLTANTGTSAAHSYSPSSAPNTPVSTPMGTPPRPIRTESSQGYGFMRTRSNSNSAGEYDPSIGGSAGVSGTSPTLGPNSTTLSPAAIELLSKFIDLERAGRHPICNLTHEILSHLFRFVDFRTLFRGVSLVCKDWRQVCFHSIQSVEFNYVMKDIWINGVPVRTLNTLSDIISVASRFPKAVKLRFDRIYPLDDIGLMTILKHVNTNVESLDINQSFELRVPTIHLPRLHTLRMTHCPNLFQPLRPHVKQQQLQQLQQQSQQQQQKPATKTRSNSNNSSNTNSSSSTATDRPTEAASVLSMISDHFTLFTPYLRNLTLRGTNLTNSELQRILCSTPFIETLNVEESKMLVSVRFEGLTNSLSYLNSISFAGCENLQHISVAHRSLLRNCREINLVMTNIDDSTVEHLCTYLGSHPPQSTSNQSVHTTPPHLYGRSNDGSAADETFTTAAETEVSTAVGSEMDATGAVTDSDSDEDSIADLASPLSKLTTNSNTNSSDIDTANQQPESAVVDVDNSTETTRKLPTAELPSFSRLLLSSSELVAGKVQISNKNNFNNNNNNNTIGALPLTPQRPTIFHTLTESNSNNSSNNNSPRSQADESSKPKRRQLLIDTSLSKPTKYDSDSSAALYQLVPPPLQVLTISWCPRIRSPRIESLSLRKLNLSACPKLQAPITIQCPALEFLDLQLTKMLTDEDKNALLESVKETAPNLQEILI